VTLPADAARRRFAIIGLILAAQTLANVGPLGIPAIASLIRADLGLTLAQAGAFVSAYYVGPLVMSIPSGAIADRWGIVTTLVGGQIVIAIGLTTASVAPSYAALIPLLMLAGCGYGMLNPTSTKAVMAWSLPGERATMVGLKQVGLPFGGALGAALLPTLALSLGWRGAVLTAAIAIGVMGIASWFFYADPPVTQTTAATPRISHMRIVFLTRDLWLLSIATGIFAALQTVWMAFLVLYLQEHVGVPLVTAGRYLALAQLSGAAGRIGFGVLSDRVFGGRRRITLAIAGTGSALCSIAIAFTSRDASAAWLVPLAIVFGAVGIGWNGVQHTWMAELAGPTAAGTAVGLGLAVSSGGVMLGPLAFGWLVEASGSFRVAWIALAVSMAIGLAILTRIRERYAMF
jgi:MFS transporter, ACS family, aldohexuronate transporter